MSRSLLEKSGLDSSGQYTLMKEHNYSSTRMSCRSTRCRTPGDDSHQMFCACFQLIARKLSFQHRTLLDFFLVSLRHPWALHPSLQSWLLKKYLKGRIPGIRARLSGGVKKRKELTNGRFQHLFFFFCSIFLKNILRAERQDYFFFNTRYFLLLNHGLELLRAEMCYLFLCPSALSSV